MHLYDAVGLTDGQQGGRGVDYSRQEPCAVQWSEERKGGAQTAVRTGREGKPTTLPSIPLVLLQPQLPCPPPTVPNTPAVSSTFDSLRYSS
jgi:hypothetical protein